MLKVLSPLLMAGVLSLVAVLSSQSQPQAADSAEIGQPFDIIFVEFCDGMDLDILRSGKVFGVQTGCDSGRVKGFVFNQGVSVSNRTAQWDIYTSGQFAGQFFVFSKPSLQLINQGTWAAAYTAGSDTLGDTPSSGK